LSLIITNEIMKDDLKIAWRNLWRNRRRTLITGSSVFFAVFFAIIMRSYQLGTYDHMISNVIESYTGHLQVQHIEYHNNPQVDNSFDYNDSLYHLIKCVENVVSVTPHLEFFSLASNGPQTRGVAVIGIDPVKEKMFSNPENKLVRYRITAEALSNMKESGIFPETVLWKLEQNKDRSYSSRARLELEIGLPKAETKKYIPEIIKFCEVPNGFLSVNDDGILVSDKLARYLKAEIGDTVVLIGHGYHGTSAAGLFPVRGIIKMPAPDLDNKLIMMTISTAQKFLEAHGKITSVSINLTDRSPRTIKKARESINKLMEGTGTTVKTWYELNPVLYQQIQGDSQSGLVMLGVLYFIIFFGIFGTVIMMVAERKKEFGVLISIGMQKFKLKRIIGIEMAMLGTLGLAGGMVASVPFIIYFFYNPIVLKGSLGKMMEDLGWDAVMPAKWFGPYFYIQSVIVAVMIFIATLYPFRKINKLKEVEALKG